jgi:hypothetical protein
MDEDGGGVSALELAYPLIALGLATDIGFVNRVMKTLAPKKFRRDPDMELNMREFSTLFRIEQISDKLVKLIKSELDQADRNEEQKKRDLETKERAKNKCNGC